MLNLLYGRDHGGVVGIDAEYHFVIWIVLDTKAGEVLIRFRVEAAHWLQIADRRREPGIKRAQRLPEVSPRTENRKQIVNERNCRDCQKNAGGGHVTPLPARTGWLLNRTLPPLSATTTRRSRPTSASSRGTADLLATR